MGQDKGAAGEEWTLIRFHLIVKVGGDLFGRQWRSAGDS
jgi:hypothetical protein